MKTIIAGCRDIFDMAIVEEAISCWIFPITEVVCGKAPGIDTVGETWAKAHKIPVKDFPADWNRFGRAAGPKRNAQMAEYSEALIAIWDQKSHGTRNIINIMDGLNKLYYVHLVTR